MDAAIPARRRSDIPDFIQTDVNIDALADDIFARYAGEQAIVVDGTPYTATYFSREYCPDFRVMKLAGELALRVNQRAARERGADNALKPLRVTVEEIMLAALLHDLGKQHEDCAPFLGLLKNRDLRGDQQKLLEIVRDVHCRKGPCMIDRLRDAGREELSNPFVITVARRHGEDYQTNRCEKQGCWWSREINVITIADDYDAIVSEGPERAYKPEHLTAQDAVTLLRQGVARGRYEPQIAEIFITDVLRLS
jgi:response regulator RpfG family c-di-GMP phosphodiesterase